jgi:hypothetical protein
MKPSKRKKGRHHRTTPCQAAVFGSGLQWSGQPGNVDLLLLRELDFLSYGFREHGQPVLNLELLDLTMAHLIAEADKFNPRGM